MKPVWAGWAGALLAVATGALAPAWAGPLAAPVFAVVAVLPLAVACGAARLRCPQWIALVGLAAPAIAATGLLVPLRDAVPRLLAAPRPAPFTPSLVAPGLLFVLLVGLAVAVRVGDPVAPVAGAATLYSAGLLLTAGRADRLGLLAAALLLLTVVGWAALTALTRPANARRLLRTVPAPLAGLVLAALATAQLVPGTGAFEPRRYAPAAVTALDEPDPLAELAVWGADADAVLFEARGAGADRLRLVTLPDFDGAGWHAEGRYRALGTVAVPALPPGRRQAIADTTIAIDHLGGRWLPTPGVPRAVSVPGALVDSDSGTLVRLDGLVPRLAYRVAARFDAPRDTDLARAGVPAGGSAARYLATPGLPDDLAAYARHAVVGARTPFEKAVALQHAVSSGAVLDTGAREGSSYARVEEFLMGQNRAGTWEQFAGAFAVLARSVGLPTRLVVGFRPGPPDQDGVRLARGADARVWPEVYFSGRGWVPLDPLPAGQLDSQTSALRRQVLSRLASTIAVPQPTDPASPGPVAHPPVHPAAHPARHPATSLRRAGPLAAAAVAALLALVAVALALRRLARAVRRRRAGPRGAWSEVLDLLALLGRPVPRGTPATAVADDLAGVLPREALAGLARLAYHADESAFAPDAPTARRARADLRLVRRAIRAAMPWPRRLRTRLHLTRRPPRPAPTWAARVPAR